MPISNRRIKILLTLIFFVYIVVRVTSNLPVLSKPRELADTIAYINISKVPINDLGFWGAERPFIFPLLLKISKQNISIVAILNLGLSILAWGIFALMISTLLSLWYLQLLSFWGILALSLVRHLAGWDYSIMTESLSISWFVLFVALGIWLAQSETWHIYKVVFLIVIAFFLAFTRDTNAYLLLMLAVMLTLATLFKFIRPRALILAAFFISIFLLNNYMSNLGEHWVFPFNNIMGRRILVSNEAVNYFKSCGMPVTPELLALANSYAYGQGRPFYENTALKNYRIWLGERGKSCYMKWLLSRPVHNIVEVLGQFESLMYFDKLNNFIALKYDPVIPNYFEAFIYPVKFIVPLWLVLTFVAIVAIWKHAWKVNILWGIYILLCLPILPHVFIIWHGDAMHPQRHALPVGLQVALCFWIMIFLLCERLASRWETRKTESHAQL